jgi:hypothetical protein
MVVLNQQPAPRRARRDDLIALLIEWPEPVRRSLAQRCRADGASSPSSRALVPLPRYGGPRRAATASGIREPGFALVAGSAVLARITPFRRDAERLATGGASPLELLAVHVERNLAGEHESLVGGQLGGELAQAADVVPISKAARDVGGWISKGSDGRLLISPVLVDGLAQGIVSRCLDRGASTERAPGDR